MPLDQDGYSKDPQGPHPLRVHLQMLDFRTRQIHPKSSPPNAGVQDGYPGRCFRPGRPARAYGSPWRWKTAGFPAVRRPKPRPSTGAVLVNTARCSGASRRPASFSWMYAALAASSWPVAASRLLASNTSCTRPRKRSFLTRKTLHGREFPTDGAISDAALSRSMTGSGMGSARK